MSLTCCDAHGMLAYIRFSFIPQRRIRLLPAFNKRDWPSRWPQRTREPIQMPSSLLKLSKDSAASSRQPTPELLQDKQSASRGAERA
jgi:hypothetical protein